ncbi:MAG: SDR family oxidoreductase [Planctomycetaceae bacterium]|nr:SDR family oxidoreductase [Planctomycetaceae bacterium]
MDFTGKTVLVTGASVGIGRDTAVLFAKHGAQVGINFANSQLDAQETLSLVTKAGGSGVLCQGDVSREDDAKRVVSTCVQKFGGLDVLVNNAGITSFIPFPELDKANADVWRRLYEVNVMGSFFCAREAARAMGDKPGVIVNVSSVAGHRPNGSSIPYAVTKAAVLHLTRLLAVTMGPNIRVVSVSPGVIDDTRWNTTRTDIDVQKMYDSAAAATPLKRTGHGSDIADAIVYMASDSASFISGVDLLVDGGRCLLT